MSLLPFRVPREDGAWWMALTCWVVGGAAAWRPAWEPLVVAIAVVGLFAGAQSLRAARRLGSLDRPASSRLLVASGIALVLPLGALLFFLWRRLDPLWLAAVGLAGLLYAPFLLSGSERSPLACLLAVTAITAVAPLTYASATGRFGAFAVALGPVHWLAAGGFILLAARAWAHRSRAERIDPRRVGNVELGFGAVAALLVLIGLRL